MSQREAVISPFVRLQDEALRNRTVICDSSFGPRKKQELRIEPLL